MPQPPVDTGSDGATAGRGAETRPFAALAEIQRRTGQIEEAERLAREGLRGQPDSVAGRVALGLALLDLGRAEEARREFEAIVDDLAVIGRPGPGPVEAAPRPEPSAGLGEALRDDELDSAFEKAETDPDQMLDATDAAREALRRADLDAPEALSPDPRSPFATPTMAKLLEQQGDREGAAAIRAALAQKKGAAPNEGSAGKRATRRIATLERWLETLRRDAR